ncbi:RND efflux system, inner membrane transporter CmeB [Fimbriiglobus ruber]|uniref:RND efflux system, inner membrane transporter CmeB n=1 Tax=Fimbriiglobus ruber TaxID=1908690 RepID=A0A225EBG1_9BACT|nr:RND efflux system, inner membrane transporter CmeB [Fimbriiglobus ruber]
MITLAGALAAFNLPISQYPPVTPPTIQVDCNYPGASAKVVSETVAAPIEQRVNGVEGMLYMASQSTSDGSYTLTVTFEIGTNLNIAQVLVQNRLNLALPELPDVVRATGVTTRKRSSEILMTVALSSPSGAYDQLYLSNYALTHIKDELARIEGISDVIVFGQRDYSMLLWIDPEKLAARDLTALDVVNAVGAQNVQVSLGQLGSPTGHGGKTQIPLTFTGRLTDESEFENIIVKADSAGRLVRVRDVAVVELGAKSLDVSNQFDRKPTVGLAVFLLSDANALETADQIMAKMNELSKSFPTEVIYEIGYDTTPFMRESIKEVFKSLRDSIVLVALVVLVFLQTWRAAIIPLAAVPVAIVGTFGVMYAFGFGLNNLTLFGLVLAVGIVVDDAIVVVEAVQHQLEMGYQPREATLRAMDEVAGPVVAVGVVLTAVFVPCAFFSGIVGQFFRQFALTIAISTIISTFNSLTLSPALAAILLRPPHARQDLPTRVVNFFFGWFFRIFNWSFDVSGRGYVWLVGRTIRIPVLVVAIYGGLLVLTYQGYLRLPIGFIPQQDKGYLIASVQLPDAASAERCIDVMGQISKIALETPGVKHANSVAGNSFVLSAYGSNFGSMFIILDGFDERRNDTKLYADNIMAELRKRTGQQVFGAQVNIFGAPAVSGLGRAGGFKYMVEDRGDFGPRMLQGQTENLMEKGNQQPGLVGLFSVYRTNSPQLFVNVDPAACSAQGVNIQDVYGVMQASLGARYVNDFNRFGRTWQVNVQADQRFRVRIDDVGRLRVKNRSGQLVPISTLAEVKEVTGPLVLTRYNMYQAAAINGNIAPGVSSGDGQATLDALAKKELPNNMAGEWTELSFIEQRSRDTGSAVFGISVLVVFLILAALYESWALPLAVILVVPLCVSCSLFGVWVTRWDILPVSEFNLTLFGKTFNWVTSLGIANADQVLDINIARRTGVFKQDVNLFTQIGFVVLIGLACKNAILIVEYAKRQRDSGADRRTAILEACRLRLRPILMTSVAFILGVVPLLIATGAGAEMRAALGTAVFAGMLGVTLFGVFLTPVFFVIVDRITEGRLFKNEYVSRLSRVSLLVVRLGVLGPFVGSRMLATRAVNSVRRRPMDQ